MALIFYTNPMSRGRIARWMLEEVGASYETRLVDWRNKPGDLLAANPMAKVPVIVHDGHVVTETAAIIAYLADVFPDAGLAPTAEERADYYRWMFFAAGPVEAAIADKSLGVEPTGEQQGMVGYGHLDRIVATLERKLTGSPFVAGDRFTAADVYLGSHVMWGMQFGTLPKRAAFEHYGARVAARRAAIRARKIDDGLIAESSSMPG